MRLLIYFLALLSGFSAAEAARADAAPSSSVMQSAVVLTEALSSQAEVAHSRPAQHRPKAGKFIEPAFVAVSQLAHTPVSRHDLATE